MFGAPFILQSDNDREFANKIIQNLADMWPGMKVVHGKPRHSGGQGSVERSNHVMFETCWLLGCPTTTRKPGPKDYGLSKARKTELCIQTSRQALMRLCFGTAQRIGLGDSELTEHTYCSTETEQELEQLFNAGMNNGRDRKTR